MICFYKWRKGAQMPGKGMNFILLSILNSFIIYFKIFEGPTIDCNLRKNVLIKKKYENMIVKKIVNFWLQLMKRFFVKRSFMFFDIFCAKIHMWTFVNIRKSIHLYVPVKLRTFVLLFLDNFRFLRNFLTKTLRFWVVFSAV